MRLLIVSDPPSAPTSWGQWTKRLAPHLQKAGHECVIYATAYHGEHMSVGGVPVFGGNGDVHGDLMGEYATRLGMDAILTLKDPYMYNVGTVRNLPVPWIATVTVDTEPMTAVVKERITYATARLAVTKNAADMMRASNFSSYYAPLGIDTDFWTPGDRDAARDALDLPRGEFIAAFVGANQTRPSRKALENILLAWSQFLYRNRETHPGAVLYLHTRLGREFGGHELQQMITAFGIPAKNWLACDQVAYQGGFIPPEDVRNVYRAADVLLSPSTGEGFCFPLVEAQSCGVPGIGMNFTAMRETLWSGWRLDRDNAELEWEPGGGFRLRVHNDALENAIKQAADTVGTDTMTRLSELARDGALKYDTDRVVGGYWLPTLNAIQSLLLEGIADGTLKEDARAVEPTRQVGRDAPRIEPQADRVVG